VRFLAPLLGLVAVILGVVVAAHDLTLKHTSRTIEALGVGLVLLGAAVVALVITGSSARSGRRF
jgi:hypothetical protein